METGLSIALTFLIGGMLLLSIMNFNSNISQTAIMNNMDLNAQIKLKGMVEVVKHDIRSIGLEIDPDDASEIESFGYNSIRFKTDINPDKDIVELGTFEIYKNNNQLVRDVFNSAGSINNDESTSFSGLDTLYIQYFNADHEQVNPGEDADNIRSLKVTLIAQLSYSYQPNDQEEYVPRAHWQSDIYPKNIGR